MYSNKEMVRNIIFLKNYNETYDTILRKLNEMEKANLEMARMV